MTPKEQEIWTAFVDSKNEEYRLLNHPSHAYINYITELKSNAVIDAIQFTIKYLKEND